MRATGLMDGPLCDTIPNDGGRFHTPGHGSGSAIQVLGGTGDAINAMIVDYVHKRQAAAFSLAHVGRRSTPRPLQHHLRLHAPRHAVRRKAYHVRRSRYVSFVPRLGCQCSSSVY
jgi:hypothetical protein